MMANKTVEKQELQGEHLIPRALVLSGVLIASAISLQLVQNRKPAVVPYHEYLDNFPQQIGNWVGGPQVEMTRQEREKLRVESYVNRRYALPNGKIVELYIGYHPEGGFHSPLNCMPGQGWQIANKRFTNVSFSAVAGETNATINLITFINESEKRVGLYWYKTCGRIVASEYWGLIYGIYDKMRLSRTDAALIRILSPADSLEPASEEDAYHRAVEFSRLVLPILSRYVPD